MIMDENVIFHPHTKNKAVWKELTSMYLLGKFHCYLGLVGAAFTSTTSTLYSVPDEYFFWLLTTSKWSIQRQLDRTALTAARTRACVCVHERPRQASGIFMYINISSYTFFWGHCHGENTKVSTEGHTGFQILKLTLTVRVCSSQTVGVTRPSCEDSWRLPSIWTSNWDSWRMLNMLDMKLKMGKATTVMRCVSFNKHKHLINLGKH